MKRIFWKFERNLLKRSSFFGQLRQEPSNLKPITIITGGSEGIGLSLARACIELELDILIIARNEEKLANAARQIKETYGVEALTMATDLTSQDSAQKIAEFIKANRLRPHILINNAGFGLSGPFLRQSQAEIDKLIALNISSLTALTRTLLPQMKKHRHGGIINISSLAGMVPGPYQAAYYASKAYVNSLSLALAQELIFTGIRVSAVAPGPVATDFHEKMGAERSAYLFIQTTLRPETVARASLIWFALGRRMIVPGLLNIFNSLAVKIIPNRVLLFIMSILLKHRS